MDPALLDLIGRLAHRLRERGWMMASAESCTGGLIAGACTELSGSSDWFERGFVTYSNRAKTEMLGVDAEVIESHGAVSEPVARAMAVGAVERSGARCAVAVTGVAGPTEQDGMPVGTLCVGIALPDGRTVTRTLRMPGLRDQMRQMSVISSLDLLRRHLLAAS